MSWQLFSRACAVALSCAGLVSHVEAAERELFVATSGNDEHPGTREQPLATLHAAQQRVRAWRTASPDVAVRVTLAAGNYYLTKPLEFTAADSGSEQSTVTYAAAPSANVRIIGGSAVNNFQAISAAKVLTRLTLAAQREVLVASLAELGIDTCELLARGHDHQLHPAGLELFYRGTPAQLARWPNNGWATVEHANQAADTTQLKFSGAAPRAWRHTNEVWAHGFWEADWSDAWQPVNGAATTNHEISILRSAEVEHVRVGARFCLLNALEELDQPGEWYVDREAGDLYFWPPAQLQRDDVVVSRWEHAISCYDVSHFTLRGLTIEATRACLVEVVRGQNVTIADCTLRNAGNCAAHIYGGQQHRIVNCDIHHTGEGGLRVEGGDRRTLTACQHVIENNDIHDYARTCHAGRPGIAAHGVGIRIANNHIHHGPDVAILLEGNDHLVERNEIDHVCLQTADAGAIYVGHDWTERGHIIRHNYLHHLGEFNRRDVMGVYLDDFASGVNVEGNVFVDAGRGVVIGGGRDNLIANNIFVDGAAGIQADARGMTWAKEYATSDRSPLRLRLTAAPIESDIYRERYPELALLPTDQPELPKGNRIERNIFRCNITVDLHDPETERLVTVRDNWSDGDPQFVDASAGDYRLRENSPALQLGFQPIPWREIGRRTTRENPSIVLSP